MKISIITSDNGVGLKTDANLLFDLLKSINSDVDIHYFNNSEFQKTESGDVGVWIQNFIVEMLPNFKKNIFFINEEWAGENELSNLKLFDVVVCKSKHAKKLLSPYSNNIEQFYFISNDMYASSESCSKTKFLHFPGRSIQKNTELVLDCIEQENLTLIDSYDRYDCNISNHITSYLPKEQLQSILMSNYVHLCPSLYESWGHYLFESLSTGQEIICSKIPVFEEVLDPDLVHFLEVDKREDVAYEYCRELNKFPLREAYFVNRSEFDNKIHEFFPRDIILENSRRKFFSHLMAENKNKLIKFFKNI